MTAHDAKGHTTTVTYDLLGRRTSISNPDTGLTDYTYDPNGNVTTKKTATARSRGNIVKYIYDFNRLVTIDYPESVDVVYEYGAPNERGDLNSNLAGRIKKVTDESGTHERFYGRLGEVVKEQRQANAFNNPVARTKYETRYVFDSFGRMLEMTYPDGEVLNYIYDSGGLLKQAYGTKRGNKYWYIKNLMYDAFGQRTRIEYGNGVYTTYTYDDKTRRLSHLLTVENAKKRTIQEISYTYDLVGNILNTNNTAPIPAGGEHGGPTDQQFTYDNLYQLVTADGAHQPGANKRTTYNNRFAYDIIGNITWKFQNHKVLHGTDSATEPRETNYDMAYKYTGSQPHAVTDAGDKLYTYDPNGNMLGWTSKTSGQKRTIVWNEENRVKSITDGGTTTFLYNDAGERVVKRGQHGESVYLNRFYSVKNGDLGSKHIFAGETRIVTKLEKDGGSLQSGVPGSIALEQSQGLQNAILQGNGQKKGIERRLTNPDGTPVTGTNPPIEKFQFFYHGDHLGSSSYITDDAGAVYQHLEYFPYGETWVESGGGGHTPGYKFTGKELDPETGLYYYGARYYDPVLSRWISADPISESYLPTEDSGQKLPGMGGVFNPINLNLYAYVHLNPLKLVDPNGTDPRHELAAAGEQAAFQHAVSKGEISLTQPGLKGGSDFITYSPEEGQIKYYDNKAYTTGKTVNEASGLGRDELNATRVNNAVAQKIKNGEITPEMGREIMQKFEAKQIKKIVTNSAPGSSQVAREGSKLNSRGMAFEKVPPKEGPKIRGGGAAGKMTGALGVFGLFSMILESWDRHERAVQNGVDDMTQLYIDYGIIAPPEMI